MNIVFKKQGNQVDWILNPRQSNSAIDWRYRKMLSIDDFRLLQVSPISMLTNRNKRSATFKSSRSQRNQDSGFLDPLASMRYRYSASHH